MGWFGAGRAAVLASARSAVTESQENNAAVLRVVQALGRARSVADATRIALDTVRESFGWAYGSFWEVDPDGEVLRFAAESGDAGPEFRTVTLAASFAEGVGLSGRAWQAKDLVFVADIGQLTDCVRAPVAVQAGVRSGVCFPVLADGRVVGTMDFFTTDVLGELSASRTEALRNAVFLVAEARQRIEEANRISSAGAELVTSIEEAERNVIAATSVAPRRRA
ncbi:GAF domain-containing protein [Pseudosporangium ferrugineum]|uniref:GAF domain-containing protein n=1 Tax=Pseudosporangium ferrugineum TaxID=439699 RepID=A0A2T0SF80_9ACTN|nr:GAF domain-containing protein [Pseudosporangium ferrugineum]